MTTENDDPAADAAPGNTDLADALAFVKGTAATRTVVLDDPQTTVAAPEAPAENDQPDAPMRDERGRFVSKEADAPAEETDPWAEAPEPLRMAHRTVEADRDSYRTKFDRARGEISRLTKLVNARPAAPQTAAAPAPKFESIDAAIAKLSEDFPDLATHLAPFAEGMRALHGQLQPVQQRIAQQDTLEAETAEAAQEGILTERHPDAREFLAQNGLALREWAGSQAPWISQIVEGNWENLVDGEGVAEVISRFRQAHQETAAATSHPQPAASAAPKPDTRRDRQLAGAASPPPTARTTIGNPPAATARQDIDDALVWVKRSMPRA